MMEMLSLFNIMI